MSKDTNFLKDSNTNEYGNKLTRIKNILLNIFYPRYCVLCNKYDVLLCIDCEKKLNPNLRQNGEFVFSKYKYKNELIRKIFFKFKYFHHKDLALRLGELASPEIEKLKQKLNNLTSSDSNIFLVPIPLSKQRLKTRNYNQSLIIAQGLDNLNTKELLIKNKNTNKLNSSEYIDVRLELINNAMNVDKIALNELLKLNSDLNLNNLKIILIDDITTTGATFFEARRALMQYGIQKENILSFALAS